MTSIYADTDLMDLHLRYPKARESVACPKCISHPGQGCGSTGGGNSALVPTHAVRMARLAGWSEAQFAAAHDLVKVQGRRPWYDMPDGYYAETEAAAAPIVAKKQSTSPKGVRLSENQAERIERAALSAGVYTVSTAHFHGDAQDRASTNALEEKGILRFVRNTDDHYDRVLELTVFGWRVYRQHRLVIRHLADDVAAAFEEQARLAELQRNADQVAATPEATANRAVLTARWNASRPLALRAVSEEARKPLGPIRGVAPVADLSAARRRRALRSVPVGGDTA